MATPQIRCPSCGKPMTRACYHGYCDTKCFDIRIEAMNVSGDLSMRRVEGHYVTASLKRALTKLYEMIT